MWCARNKLKWTWNLPKRRTFVRKISMWRSFCWQRAGGMYLLCVELQRRLKPVKQSEIEESEKEVGMQKCNDLWKLLILKLTAGGWEADVRDTCEEAKATLWCSTGFKFFLKKISPFSMCCAFPRCPLTTVHRQNVTDVSFQLYTKSKLQILGPLKKDVQYECQVTSFNDMW